MERNEVALDTIRTLKDAVNPEKCKYTGFFFEYDGSENGFRVLMCVSRMNDAVVVGEDEEMIVADMKNRRLLRAGYVDLSRVKHNEIVDMSVDGDRWEGDVLNGKPFGWGVLYDKSNCKVYEGFRVWEWNVCYGVSYYSDIERIEYEGEWYNGNPWGRGVKYDRNGDVVYDGEWLDGDYSMTVRITPEMSVFHNGVKELIVSDGSCNGEEMTLLDLGMMPSLTSLIVGNECFMFIDVVKLIGLNELESVEIGKNSFTKYKDTYHITPDPNRHFCLKNCPKLKSLKMGCYSFSDYTVCAIENVDALEVIEMGDLNDWSCNFYYASLELKSVLIHNE